MAHYHDSLYRTLELLGRWTQCEAAVRIVCIIFSTDVLYHMEICCHSIRYTKQQDLVPNNITLIKFTCLASTLGVENMQYSYGIIFPQ